ncbi:indoleamine 2,3-dioxygenase [Patescibacteria group bacterium AH-259-L05]|nr:indoleamine 2,3-dioxygenase [Patescibacteria group bacterium AH-259-L05]
MSVDMREINTEVRKIMKRHGVSYKTGFLAEKPLRWIPFDQRNPSEQSRCYQWLDTTAHTLPELIAQKAVRKRVEMLETPSWLFVDLDREVINLLLLNFTMIIHAYFRETFPYSNVGELMQDESIKYVPPQLAIPAWELSKIVGMHPVMSYCLYSPCNYYIPDQNKALSLDNIELIHSFTNTLDEKWFVWDHQVVEKIVAPAIPALLKAYLLCKRNDPPVDAIVYYLSVATRAHEKAVDVLERMREHCDYQTYFDQVRLFYSFPKNVVFEGVDELKGEPQNFFGETGGQSPFMHLRLAILGIDHYKDPYFAKMRDYMPKEFRSLIELIGDSKIRQFVLDCVKKGEARPVRRYNALVMSILAWEAEHITLVDDYIKQYGEVYGTGKPPLEWLRHLYDKTKSKLIL